MSLMMIQQFQDFDNLSSCPARYVPAPVMRDRRIHLTQSFVWNRWNRHAATKLMSRGTLAHKERWLPAIATMEKVAAWAITEPDSGSDAFGGMQTYVRRDGDEYILHGRKTFITNGPAADILIVYAKLDE